MSRTVTDRREKVAIVTGAASGIGAALARRLADEGATVTAVDLDRTGLAGLPAEITTEVLDVCDAAAVRDLVARTAATNGRLDMIFNNAGIVVGGPFEDTDDIAWQRIVDVNLWGVVHGSRAAWDIMLEQGFGHIVNTASSAGVMPVARSTAYAATKHAVVGLSTSLRAEAAGRGVAVSVVLPGVVDTGIFAAAHNVGGYDYQRSIQRVPFAKVSSDAAAAAILHGVDRNRAFIAFPRYNRALVALSRLVPETTSRLINSREHT